MTDANDSPEESGEELDHLSGSQFGRPRLNQPAKNILNRLAWVGANKAMGGLSQRIEKASETTGAKKMQLPGTYSSQPMGLKWQSQVPPSYRGGRPPSNTTADATEDAPETGPESAERGMPTGPVPPPVQTGSFIPPSVPSYAPAKTTRTGKSIGRGGDTDLGYGNKDQYGKFEDPFDYSDVPSHLRPPT